MILFFLAASLAMAQAPSWTEPIIVRHDTTPCISYRARLQGQTLVLHAKIEPGWHTFSMDNKLRAEEKLAGKQSLGIDAPTEIRLSGALETTGGWRQTEPKDFSKPDLRWYSWGFENEALFAAPVRVSGAGPASIRVRGQACTETICKQIDVTISVPLNAGAAGPEVDLQSLVAVR
ncbi:MAG: hypothetical protein FJW20_21065 [Acidimicrobiia bacterium]|nr:hypothetical protein [Acidimicrobiia bacterium]